MSDKEALPDLDEFIADVTSDVLIAESPKMSMYLVTILTLLPKLSTFNIDTGKAIRIEGAEGQFGTSLAATGHLLYVGSPKSNGTVGQVYKCNLKDVDFSKAIHQKDDMCSNIGVPPSPDPVKVTEEKQGLGESLAVNHATQRLAICAPRRKSRYYSFCLMQENKKFANLRGICYEVSTVTDEVVKTHDSCKVANWTVLTQSREMQFAKSKYSCLQLQYQEAVDGLGKIVFHLSGGEERSLDINYSTSEKTFSFTYEGNFILKYPCDFAGLSLYYNKQKSVNSFKLYCHGLSGFKIELQDLDLSKLTFIELSGFSKYWLDEYDLGTITYRAQLEDVYDNCMLGYSAWYDPTNQLVLSAPGANIHDVGVFGGGIFVNGVLDPGINDLTNMSLKGLVYRSAEIHGVLWSATSGQNTNSVIISKDRVVSQIISEEYSPSGFGDAILLWKGGNKLQLVIADPHKQHRGQLDCGAIYIYTLNPNKDIFEKTQWIFGEPCGGFGHTMVNIGDIDGDNYTDIAVGAVYVNSVHIIMGSESGIDNITSQIIRPKSNNVTYSNIFGYDITRHESSLAISDPVAHNVYIYRTLPVWDCEKTVTCPEVLDIDASPSNISCKICFNLSARTQTTAEVNVKISWKISHSNISYVNDTTDHIVYTYTDLGKNSCVTAEFSRTIGSDIRYFNLENGVGITFTFDQGPHPQDGRVVAVDPRTMQAEEVQVETIGLCGKDFCEADFSLHVQYHVERFEDTDSFKNVTERNDSVLYFGGSREVIVFNVSVDAVAGVFLDEVLSIDLNETFQVEVQTANCIEASKSSNIAIVISSETCAGDQWSCPGDSFVRCNQISGNEEGKLVQIHLPVVRDAYLNPQLQINFTLKPLRNRDTNLSNNEKHLHIPIIKFLELSVKSRLQPFHLTNIRLRNYQSKSSSLQGYGPEQRFVLELSNEGSSRVAMTALSVIYPITYKGSELVYVAEVESSAAVFHCSEQTVLQINYRNLKDVNVNDTSADTSKLGSLLVEPCHDSHWKCVNLTCFIESVKPGSSATLSIKTYINAEYASNFINITIPISFSRTFFDTNFVAAKTVEYQTIETVVEVLPGLINTMWYVVGAAVGGFIILAAFVIVLIKCGFFSRKKRDQMKIVKVLEIDALTEEEPVYSMPVK